jgi:hypothetical protein
MDAQEETMVASERQYGNKSPRFKGAATSTKLEGI